MVRLLAALSILMTLHVSAQAQSNYGTRVACPLILAPVCGQRGEETRTFANKCQAERQGWAVIRTGSCDGTPRSQLKLLP
ncbi:MAG: hypothetical protein KF723_08600 [Rhizobiaceae bacterium]|nr:hypothetical protein [Rhizobiaceae bacterium]